MSKKWFWTLPVMIAGVVSAPAWPEGGGATGVGSGGDPLEMKEQRIRAFIENELKFALTALIGEMGPKIAASKDRSVFKAREMIKQGLLQDIQKSRYDLQDTCKDDAGAEKSATAILGDRNGPICFDARKLAKQNATKRDMLALALHEHSHHFGHDDKDYAIAYSFMTEPVEPAEPARCLEEGSPEFCTVVWPEERLRAALNKVKDAYPNSGLLFGLEAGDPDYHNYMDTAERYGNIRIRGNKAPRTLTDDALVLALCETVGYGLQYSGSGVIAYFAASKCARRIFALEDNQRALSEVRVDPVAVEKCAQAFASEEDRLLCQRVSQAAVNLVNYKQDYAVLVGRSAYPPVSLGTPDRSVLSHYGPYGAFKGGYGSQCVLDTFFAGALCNRSPEVPLYDGGNPFVGICSMSQGDTIGVPPACVLPEENKGPTPQDWSRIQGRYAGRFSQSWWRRDYAPISFEISGLDKDFTGQLTLQDPDYGRCQGKFVGVKRWNYIKNRDEFWITARSARCEGDRAKEAYITINVRPYSKSLGVKATVDGKDRDVILESAPFPL